MRPARPLSARCAVAVAALVLAAAAAAAAPLGPCETSGGRSCTTLDADGDAVLHLWGVSGDGAPLNGSHAVHERARLGKPPVVLGTSFPAFQLHPVSTRAQLCPESGPRHPCVPRGTPEHYTVVLSEDPLAAARVLLASLAPLYNADTGLDLSSSEATLAFMLVSVP